MMEKTHYGGFEVICNPYIPKDQIYIMNRNMIVHPDLTQPLIWRCTPDFYEALETIKEMIISKLITRADILFSQLKIGEHNET